MRIVGYLQDAQASAAHWFLSWIVEEGLFDRALEGIVKCKRLPSTSEAAWCWISDECPVAYDWCIGSLVQPYVVTLFLLCILGLFLGLTHGLFRLVGVDLLDSVRRFANEYFRSFISRVIDWYRIVTVEVSAYRNEFANMQDVDGGFAKNHSHGHAAQERSAAVTMCEHFAALVGKSVFMVQSSNTDQRRERRGNRTYHWMRDVTVPSDSRQPDPDRDICVYIDVDMYLDMPYFLSRHPMPTLIYTFQPLNAAFVADEYNYRFLEDQRVRYVVTGGSTYEHLVWTYSQDVLSVHRWNWFSDLTIEYNVDRRPVGRDHQLILLTPAALVRMPVYNLCRLLGGRALSRLNPVNDGLVTLDICSIGSYERSFAFLGEYQDVKIPVTVYDEAKNLFSYHTSSLTISTVVALMKDKEVRKGQAAILLNVLKKKITPGAIVMVPELAVKVYQRYTGNLDERAKPAMRVYMNPLMLGSAVPRMCRDSEIEAVNERVLKIKSLKLPLTSKHTQYIREFVGLILGKVAGTLEPLLAEDVFDRQKRPNQRVLLQQADSLDFSDDGKNSTFLKRESYSEEKPPRIITTLPSSIKLEYSQYLYAVSDLVIKPCRWYAFGKTPREIQDEVVRICANALMVVSTDLSRFDGRVSNILRSLEHHFMLTAFQSCYNSKLLILLNQQRERVGVTTTGVKYFTGDSRLSGSPETADFNSLCNAFMAYMTFREMGCNSVVSYSRLGIYGGDDGLTPDVDEQIYTRQCLDVGQVLTCETFKRGACGVNFLARFYSPYVWAGDPNNMCDLRRQLLKLHLCVDLPDGTTPLDKLIDKLAGYYMTDHDSPVLGELTQIVKTFDCNFIQREPLSYRNYWSKFDEDQQYTNIRADWMLVYALEMMPDFDYLAFNNWVDSITELNWKELILTPYLCNDVNQFSDKFLVNGMPPAQPPAPLVLVAPPALLPSPPSAPVVQPKGKQRKTHRGKKMRPKPVNAALAAQPLAGSA
jgi:hypothetical protein